MLDKESSVFDLEEQRHLLWEKLLELSSEDWKHKGTLTSLNSTLSDIYHVESFWAYPGKEVLFRISFYLHQEQKNLFKQLVQNTLNALTSESYRSQIVVAFSSNLQELDKPQYQEKQSLTPQTNKVSKKTYFEVLIVHPNPTDYDLLYRNSIANFKTDRDEFIYDILFVDNSEDAISAILANPSIQSVVFINDFKEHRSFDSPMPIAYDNLRLPNGIECYEEKGVIPAQAGSFNCDSYEVVDNKEKSLLLKLVTAVNSLRSELDLFYICETPLHEITPAIRTQFQRILYHIDPFQSLHHAILNGIRDRYSTPFFHALQAYSQKPHGVFHALPLSQGRSLQNSHWIQDMLEFYGNNTFLAETSSTQGGLDSLLDPKGAIKQAHHKISQTFGSSESYLVTNGTSTSNKIVMQTTLQPGDLVIISADCHKSIPYSVMLTGALPIFLETYPLQKHDLYGGVTLERIKEVMLDLKDKGKLHLLKHITLTNSTFDGLIYNTERFMLDILAIKPDIIFHWDEAWFAFANFNPIYHSRTAMTVTQRLKVRFQCEEYLDFYQSWKKSFDKELTTNPKAYLTHDLYPDPHLVKLRVYATQSTHKTLTSFRQGSMIHIDDACFKRDLFFEAYRMHTSTSPNYQILASLDVGRRQASLEGYERVKKTIALALKLRQKIKACPIVSQYFKVLGDDELVPSKYRSSLPKNNSGFTYTNILKNWGNAHFVVDPTRVTVDVKLTGMDGNSFRQLLMNKYNIQVNKTSENTVLFLVNIGSTFATITYLLDVLRNVSELLNTPTNHSKPTPKSEVTHTLPQRRYFSEVFMPFECSSCDIGDMRSAYYASTNDDNIEYTPLNNQTIKDVLDDKKLVSASFVTPYPPGFPVLTPGQIITYDILMYLQKIKIKEIHGYQADQGLKIFKQSYLNTYKLNS